MRVRVKKTQKFKGIGGIYDIRALRKEMTVNALGRFAQAHLCRALKQAKELECNLNLSSQPLSKT